MSGVGTIARLFSWKCPSRRVDLDVDLDAPTQLRRFREKREQLNNFMDF